MLLIYFFLKLFFYTFFVSCVIVVRSSAAASQLSASVLLNCVVKYSLSELPQLNNPNTVIEPELKAVLGRLRLLRTVSWRSNTHRLRAGRKRFVRRQKRGWLAW